MVTQFVELVVQKSDDSPNRVPRSLKLWLHPQNRHVDGIFFPISNTQLPIEAQGHQICTTIGQFQIQVLIPKPHNEGDLSKKSRRIQTRMHHKLSDLSFDLAKQVEV